MIRTDAGDAVSCPTASHTNCSTGCAGSGRATSDHCIVCTDLSFQEVSILRMLAAGLSNKQISSSTTSPSIQSRTTCIES